MQKTIAEIRAERKAKPFHLGEADASLLPHLIASIGAAHAQHVVELYVKHRNLNFLNASPMRGSLAFSTFADGYLAAHGLPAMVDIVPSREHFKL
jgi:hypothetical protein